MTVNEWMNPHTPIGEATTKPVSEWQTTIITYTYTHIYIQQDTKVTDSFSILIYLILTWSPRLTHYYGSLTIIVIIQFSYLHTHTLLKWVRLVHIYNIERWRWRTGCGEMTFNHFISFSLSPSSVDPNILSTAYSRETRFISENWRKWRSDRWTSDIHWDRKQEDCD